MTACSECGKPIHPERLAAIPAAKTCSMPCSDKRSKKRQAAGSRRAKAKRQSAKRKRRGQKYSSKFVNFPT